MTVLQCLHYPNNSDPIHKIEQCPLALYPPQSKDAMAKYIPEQSREHTQLIKHEEPWNLHPTHFILQRRKMRATVSPEPSTTEAGRQ